VPDTDKNHTTPNSPSVFNRYARRSLQGDQRHGEAACRRVSFVAHTAARSPCVGEIKRMDGETQPQNCRILRDKELTCEEKLTTRAHMQIREDCRRLGNQHQAKEAVGWAKMGLGLPAQAGQPGPFPIPVDPPLT
jgi:hypothetical protein